MLLAQPIRRTTLLWSHATVSIIGLLLLCLLVWAGLSVGVHATTVQESVEPPTFRIPILNFELPLSVDEPVREEVPLRDRVDVRTYAASTFHLFSFGFFLLGLTSMFSALDRYRWRTVGTVVGFYVLQAVMFGLGKATEKLEWLLSFTFFSCYKPQMMTSMVTTEGLAAPWSLTSQTPEAMLPPLAYPLILIGLGICFYAIAAACFRRRDLPAPL